ncbi:ubiquinone biosynthesis monooxygenase COQ6, mitochondrial isoform X2 [Folsomia candida]|uniref:ubiquinone biosynthesis monooxygenase COQ6, mitochondrial isoform X2 n=1 Tax=Folsomia candida TaxID=158441 RepID=UPI000B8F5144|nr:ubiquinone biosynthesis monooxygenase COQ6, mitochondrial isoform X2 [Folsomia candida]
MRILNPLTLISNSSNKILLSKFTQCALFEQWHHNRVLSTDAAPPQKTAEFYDIVIAGGGLVGTILAVALGQLSRLSNKKILMLESADKFWTKGPESIKTSDDDPDFSNRVVALSPGSKKFLAKLGIWEEVWRSRPVSCLQVWDALSDAHISFNNSDYQQPVAHIVENAVLAHAVSKFLNDVSNVTVAFGSSLKSCVIPSESKLGEKAYISLKDERMIATDLLIGADGFNSRVRTTMGSPYLGFNYDRMAVVATLKLNEPTDNRAAWQRFVPTGGPIALLPFSSLVWSTTPEYAKKLLNMTVEEFVDAVNSAFWQEYSQSPLVKKSCEILSTFNLRNSGPKIYPPSIMDVVEKSRAAFPLGFGHSSFYVSRRTALIGDAAHRLHPLAGQGLNLGIGDAETLQRVLDDVVGIGGDIGSLDNLKEYETERQRHNLAIQGGVDFLHRLYNYEFAPVVALRTIGLSVFNSSETLKRAIMSQASA